MPCAWRWPWRFSRGAFTSSRSPSRQQRPWPRSRRGPCRIRTWESSCALTTRTPRHKRSGGLSGRSRWLPSTTIRTWTWPGQDRGRPGRHRDCGGTAESVRQPRARLQRHHADQSRHALDPDVRLRHPNRDRRQAGISPRAGSPSDRRGSPEHRDGGVAGSKPGARAHVGPLRGQGSRGAARETAGDPGREREVARAELSAGAVSAFEVTQARIALENTRLARDDAARQQAEARVQLAAALGVAPRPSKGCRSRSTTSPSSRRRCRRRRCAVRRC